MASPREQTSGSVQPESISGCATLSALEGRWERSLQLLSFLTLGRDAANFGGRAPLLTIQGLAEGVEGLGPRQGWMGPCLVGARDVPEGMQTDTRAALYCTA